MKKMAKIELLSPVGNMVTLKQAIYNGADAVYLGGKKFGARKFANNFTNDELIEAIKFVHLYGKKIYITVNTIVFNDEIAECLEYLEFLYKNNVDAVIMQDLGLIDLAHKKFPNLDIHASTQCHNHNIENIKFMKELGVKRVILARELSLKEINSFDTNMDLEIFIHGALCVSYSGCCLFSSLNGTRSGNRGECVGSCRLPYKLADNDKSIETGGNFLLSMKDLNAAYNLEEILRSNVKSLKIEGRMKSPEYVGYVTRFYRKLIDQFYASGHIIIEDDDIKNLKKLFNREFTKGYLFNEDNGNIANINSSNHIGIKLGKIIEIKDNRLKIMLEEDFNQEDAIRVVSNNRGMYANLLYNEKGLLVNKVLKGNICYVDNKIGVTELGDVLKTVDSALIEEIDEVNELKIPITFNIKAQIDKPLYIQVDDGTNILENNYDVVQEALKTPITKENIYDQFSKVGNTIYSINQINIINDSNIFISLKSLNEARRNILEQLDEIRKNKKKEIVINNFDMNFECKKTNKKTINVLVRNEEQLIACLNENVNIYVTDYKLYQKYKSSNVYYRTERVMSKFNDFHDENLLICETGSLKYAKNNNVISDYYLNVVNDYTINLLHKTGIKKITLSPELDATHLKQLNLKNFNLELIVYGRLELMVMKYCPLNKLLNNGVKPCNICSKQYYLQNDAHKYPIISSNCYTHILHYRNIDLIDKINQYDIDNYRIELFDETNIEVINLINRVKKEIE